jgi:hypothetical protein
MLSESHTQLKGEAWASGPGLGNSAQRMENFRAGGRVGRRSPRNGFGALRDFVAVPIREHRTQVLAKRPAGIHQRENADQATLLGHESAPDVTRG